MQTDRARQRLSPVSRLHFSGRYKLSDLRFCECAINIKSPVCSETLQYVCMLTSSFMWYSSYFPSSPPGWRFSFSDKKCFLVRTRMRPQRFGDWRPTIFYVFFSFINNKLKLFILNMLRLFLTVCFLLIIFEYYANNYNKNKMKVNYVAPKSPKLCSPWQRRHSRQHA